MDNKQKKPIQLDGRQSKWYIFPDMLSTGRFKGYESREDETQNQGAFPVGQNITFANSRIPTLRQGFEVIGTEAADATPVKSAWTFETRGGVQYELKTYSTFVDYRIEGVMTSFLHLITGLTSGLEFGHANLGIQADLTSYTEFCNGTDSFYKFSGAYGLYASDNGSTTITLQGSTTLANLGFTATGTIMINNVAITYTGLSGQTFTGCSSVPVGPTVGDVVVQSPVVVSALSSFLTSVMMAHDGRLHARLDTKPAIWNYSKLDNPFDWTAGSTDGDGGAKEVEFGGPITAFGKLNKTALCFKKGIIKTLSFVQSGTRLDAAIYKTLVSADDKGTTLGAVNQKSTFSTPLGMVFVTPDKRMVLLNGVTANDEPQYIFLSDPIQPTFTNGVHTSGVGICIDNVIYYSFKESVNSDSNDIMLRGDLTRQTITSEGKIIPIQWDTPYVGLNANDFNVVYNSTLGRNEIHFHSSLNSSSYKIITDKTDATNSFTAIIRSWLENFGMPNIQKKIGNAFIDLKMTENTNITATLLYDEDGSTGRTEYALSGANDTAKKFDASVYNPFGASSFGAQKTGSSPLSPNAKKYRFYLETENNLWFYHIALQLSLTDPGNDLQLIRFGFEVTDVLAEPDIKYKKSSS